jgi:DNA-directed RNA polymerase specialized sigma24 family protein
MPTVREAIVRAFQYVQITFDEQDVAVLEAKIAAQKIAPAQPGNFAFVVARNWAIGQLRKSAYNAKRILREERAAEEKRQADERKRLAYDAYLSLCHELHQVINPTQHRHLEMVRLTCFERLSARELSSRFPGVSADCRYQWKKRGLDLIWSRATPVLRDYLAGCTVRPRSK